MAAVARRLALLLALLAAPLILCPPSAIGADKAKAPAGAKAPEPVESIKLPEVAKAPEPPKPIERTGGGFPGDGWKLLVGSLVLAALVFAAARGVKRLPIARFLPSAEGTIRVTARTHLGVKEQICLVEVGSTALLIGVTAQGIQTLHVWPQGLGIAAPPAGPAGRTGFDPAGVPGQLKSLVARLGVRH